jgi:hypothetical protein
MVNQAPMLKLCVIAVLPMPALAAPIYSNDFESTPDAAGIWSHSKTTYLGDPYTTILGNFAETTINFTLNATEENTAGLGGPAGGGDGNGNHGGYNISVREYRANRRPTPYPDTGSGGGGTGGTPPISTFDGPKIDLGNAIGGNNEPPNTDPLFTTGRYSLSFDLMLFDSWDGNYDGYGPDKIAIAINGETVFDEFFEIFALVNNFRRPDEIPSNNAFSSSWRDLIYRDITFEFEIDQATDVFNFEFIGSPNQGIADESWGIDNVRVDAMTPLAPASVPAVPAPASLTLLGAGLGLVARRRRSV